MRSILLVSDSEGWGGAEIALCTVAGALSRIGIRVSLAVPPLPSSTRAAIAGLIPRAVTVLESEVPLRASGLQQLLPALRRQAAAAVEQIVRLSHPDAVLINLHILWAGAAILDALRPVAALPVAGYLQLGKLPSQAGALMGRLRDLWIPAHLARFDMLLAVAERQVGALRGVAGAVPIHTVYQAVAATERADWPSREQARTRLGLGPKKLVGVVGRVWFAHKGHDTIVRVADCLAQRGCDVEWVVVGDGPDLPRLKERVRQARLDARFHFLGWRDRPTDLLPAFDVVAMPSRYEGLPLVAVEAMSARVPVVAFGVDGLADLLQPPFSVEAGDEGAFAAALQQTLTSGATWDAERYARRASDLCSPEAVARRVAHALLS